MHRRSFFCYSAKTMSIHAKPAAEAADNKIKDLLEWLATNHNKKSPDDTEELLGKLAMLRESLIAPGQRLKLLDLLHAHADRIVQSERPRFNNFALPLSRKSRQKVRLLLELLDTVTLDYFNALNDSMNQALAESKGNGAPAGSLRRLMISIGNQIRIHHQVASPPRSGLWEQAHLTYRIAQRTGNEEIAAPRGGQSIQRLYSNLLLLTIAHPASFSSDELDFIDLYVAALPDPIRFEHSEEQLAPGIFWIDPDRDFPAHALPRRMPAGNDLHIQYFSCAEAAACAGRHLKALKKGGKALALGLPAFADTPAGQGVLKRLVTLWGNPTKRKYPRRHQSYRARLSSGLDASWKLLNGSGQDIDYSEWMVTNESPEGFALMHISGDTSELRVGDPIALQVMSENSRDEPHWQLCIVRWAISENPEHIEIGLQLLSARPLSAKLALPYTVEGGHTQAILLPAIPALGKEQALIVRSGLLKENARRIVLMIERGNLEIREVRTSTLDDQTQSIDIFSIRTET